MAYDKAEAAGLKALVVNDEGDHAALIGIKLNNAGVGFVYTAACLGDARRVASSKSPDIFIVDTEVGREWGPNFAEELFKGGAKPYVVGTCTEARYSQFWEGVEIASFHEFLKFDAAKVVEGYFHKKGGTTRRLIGA